MPTTVLFCPQIAWPADNRITNGSTDAGHARSGFHPTAAVSRQAMAAFRYRFAALAGLIGRNRLPPQDA